MTTFGSSVSGPKVRLGIIGIGLIAQAVHLKNLGTLREMFEIVHMCDLSPTLASQMASEWGSVPGGGRVVASTDPETLFDDENVEAVLILTPGTHAFLTRRALLSGKHVLAEKPFSATAEEAEELFALSNEVACVLQVGYMKMYDPIIPRARQELITIGDLRLIRVTVLHPADDPQYAHQRYIRYQDADLSGISEHLTYENEKLTVALGDTPEPWRSLYNDVFLGSTVHEMAVLRALFGELPFTVRHAQIGAHTAGEKLSEPPQLQMLGTLGDVQLAFSWNWLPDYPEYLEEIVVLGSAGRLTLRYPGPYLADHRSELVVEKESGSERSENRLVSDFKTGFLHELMDFYNAIRTGSEVKSTARGAAWDVRGLQLVIAALARDSGGSFRGESCQGEGS